MENQVLQKQIIVENDWYLNSNTNNYAQLSIFLNEHETIPVQLRT